jgi:hypothetical protein
MKFLSVSKDGGPESRVWAYWLCEIKSLFSVCLLKFEDGSRDAFHDHAFNAVSWVLKGKLQEETISPEAEENTYEPSLRPVITLRNTFHKVTSTGTTWVLSIRGPWADQWHEYANGKESTLTHGRVEVK